MSHPIPVTEVRAPLAPRLRLVRETDEVLSTEALIERAQAAERDGRRDEARQLYERALHRLGPGDSPMQASALLRWIGRTHQVDANPDLALDCLEAALAIAESCGDDASIGHATNLQAIVHWQLGELDEAERLYLRARESALRAGEARLAAITAQNLGVIANIRGDLDSALRHYETALAGCRALGLAKDVCHTLNNLGMLYTDMHQWEPAERVYQEAIEISTTLGDSDTRAMIEVNLAECWVSQGDFARATDACDRAVSLTTQGGDNRALGEAYKIYGIIAREGGDLAKAESQLDQAERHAEERQDLLLQAEVAREKAELHRRQNRCRDTLQCLNRSHRLFSQLRARREMADVDRRTTELEATFLEVVRRWSESIESKDHYTQGHCERVADLACALAARTGMDAKSLFWFRIGALLHDVGKLVIPSEVLNKPTALTAYEWELVRRHPSAGVEMLADIDFPWDVRPLVESHHERWDGTGYPHGLAGEAIPQTARILCLADVYDALTSVRSYKRALSHVEAIDIMRRDAGRQFDPELFSAFEGLFQDGRLDVKRARPTPTRTMAVARDGGGGRDDLTGLPLRRDLFARLQREVSDGTNVSVLVIDVDRFKHINDTHGHLVGDEVLRSVAKALQKQVRADSFLARYAGDEFVLVLPGLDIDEAAGVADRLRAAVEQIRPARRPSDPMGVAVTLSIGVASAPTHGNTAEELFEAADGALLEAKRRGRNAVIRAGNGETRPRPCLERFVGRGDELRRLIHLFEGSTRGDSAVVAVCGEAGVGKSTLLRALSPEVRMRAGSLVLGRAVEGVSFPYAPWASVISALRVLRIVRDDDWRELPRLVPTIDAGPDRDSESPGTRYALFEEVLAYLRAASASRPLVIVLDDMQWADAGSWELLGHVISHIDHDRILICLTIRTDERSSTVSEHVARLARDPRFHRVMLPRLSAQELREWAEAVFGQEVGADFLGFLQRHTEGNPLFAVQLIRMLLDEGAIWFAGDRWQWRPISEMQLPVAIHDLIARRLERLSPKARRVLTTAAVIGRAFDLDLALATDAGTEDDLCDALDEGIAAAVLEPVGDRFAFTHNLLVDVLRAGCNPRRRGRIHERIARALEQMPEASVAELASHYDAAGIADKAYRFALEAAAHAGAVYAHEEAAAYLAVALRHASVPAEVAHVRRELARAAESAGRYDRAAEYCESALAFYHQNGPAADALELRRMRERLHAAQDTPARITLDRCRALLAEAEAAGLDRERVALMGMLSHAHGRLGEPAEAEDLAARCVELAESIGDTALVADALLRLGSTTIEARPSDAVELFSRAQALFRECDDRYGQLRSALNMGCAHSRAGNTSAAETALTDALVNGRSSYAPDITGLAAMNLGVHYMKAGRYDLARERFQEALRLFTTVKNEHHRLVTLYNLAHLAREQHDHGTALGLYRTTEVLARTVGFAPIEIGALAGAGLSELALGGAREAAADLEAALSLAGERPAWWFQGRELLEALRIRMLLADGNVIAAWTAFVRAHESAEEHDVYGAAWLVAECASSMAAAGLTEIWTIAARHEAGVRTLGFAPLSARYASLRLPRGGANGSRKASGDRAVIISGFGSTIPPLADGPTP